MHNQTRELPMRGGVSIHLKDFMSFCLLAIATKDRDLCRAVLGLCRSINETLTVPALEGPIRAKLIYAGAGTTGIDRALLHLHRRGYEGIIPQVPECISVVCSSRESANRIQNMIRHIAGGAHHINLGLSEDGGEITPTPSIVQLSGEEVLREQHRRQEQAERSRPRAATGTKSRPVHSPPLFSTATASAANDSPSLLQ